MMETLSGMDIKISPPCWSELFIREKAVKSFIEQIDKIDKCASQEIFIQKIKELAGDKLI